MSSLLGWLISTQHKTTNMNLYTLKPLTFPLILQKNFFIYLLTNSILLKIIISLLDLIIIKSFFFYIKFTFYYFMSYKMPLFLLYLRFPNLEPRHLIDKCSLNFIGIKKPPLMQHYNLCSQNLKANLSIKLHQKHYFYLLE